jgi:hypothetical protein
MIKKELKLKTKLEFRFDTVELELDKDISYDIEFKPKKTKIMTEVRLPTRINRHKVQDASTKLF